MDSPHPGRSHAHLAPGPPLWLCVWVQVSAACGQRKVETTLWGHGDNTAGHTIIPSLSPTSLVSVFPLYMGTEGAGPEVSGTSNTQVPTLLLSSRLYRKWKENIPNPSKSLLFQVRRQALLLAPCPITVTVEKGGGAERVGEQKVGLWYC